MSWSVGKAQVKPPICIGCIPLACILHMGSAAQGTLLAHVGEANLEKPFLRRVERLFVPSTYVGPQGRGKARYPSSPSFWMAAATAGAGASLALIP